MRFKLFVVLEALVNIVPGCEVFHATVHGSVKGWSGDHCRAAAILQLFVNLFEPKRNYICVFVANNAKVTTNLAHVVGAEECIFTGKSKLQIISHLSHAPRLVHLGDRVIGVNARSVAASLENLLKVLE